MKRDLLSKDLSDILRDIAREREGMLTVQRNASYKKKNGDTTENFSAYTLITSASERQTIVIEFHSQPGCDVDSDRCVFVVRGDHYIQIWGDAVDYAGIIIRGSMDQDFDYHDNSVEELGWILPNINRIEVYQ